MYDIPNDPAFIVWIYNTYNSVICLRVFDIGLYNLGYLTYDLNKSELV